MQPKGVSVYAEATSKMVNKITGAKTIIQPRLNTIRNRWVRQPQPIPSSVFWNREYEFVHPLGWVEGGRSQTQGYSVLED